MLGSPGSKCLPRHPSPQQEARTGTPQLGHSGTHRRCRLIHPSRAADGAWGTAHSAFFSIYGSFEMFQVVA